MATVFSAKAFSLVCQISSCNRFCKTKLCYSLKAITT